MMQLAHHRTACGARCGEAKSALTWFRRAGAVDVEKPRAVVTTRLGFSGLHDVSVFKLDPEVSSAQSFCDFAYKMRLHLLTASAWHLYSLWIHARDWEPHEVRHGRRTVQDRSNKLAGVGFLTNRNCSKAEDAAAYRTVSLAFCRDTVC